MIKLNQLTVIYPANPTNVIANRGLDLEIKDKGLTVITGPNGSGKSTLFKVLAGELTPTAGSFEIDGLLVANHLVAEQLAKLFCYTPQDLLLNQKLSGQQQFESSDLLDSSNLDYLLKQLGIESDWYLPIERLGRDRRQLIGLTLGLLSVKKHLLLDEPTKYLPQKDRVKLFKVLAHLAKSRSILIATHDPRWAKAGGNSIHIQDGKVVQSGGRNAKDNFGWVYQGDLLKPASLNSLKKHKKITKCEDLSTFNKALSNARGKYLVFDPESRAYDQITTSELYSFNKVKLAAKLESHKDQRLATLSGGERGWSYLNLLLAKKPKQLFLLYPSLNLDQSNQESLQKLVVKLADAGCQITIFDSD